MAVTGNLGGQPITLDNAASEQTLMRIEQIMASQASGPNGTAQRQAAANAAQNLANQANRAGVDIQNLGSYAQGTSLGLTSLNRSASGFKRATDSAISATQNFGASLNNQKPFEMAQRSISMATQAATYGLEGLGNTLPIVGSALGKVGAAGATVVGFLAGTFVGAVQATAEEFFKMQKAGGLFAGDLIEFRSAANSAGLQMGQYNEVIARAGTALSSFGGTTVKGANEFAQANSVFVSGYSDTMLRMGIDYTDMGVRTAEFLEQVQLSGTALGRQAVTARQVAQGAANLAKSQKVLSTLNGESIEQQKQRARQMATDAAFQAALQGMNVEQRNEMTKLITQFPHLSQAIKETIVTGDAVSAQAIMGVQAAGKQGEIVLEGVRQITEDVDPATAVNSILRNLELNSEQISNDLGEASEVVKLGILGVNSDFVNAYTDQFLPLQRTAVQAGSAAFTNIETDMGNMETAASQATQSVIQIQQDFQRASINLSTAVTDILDSNFGQDVTKLIALPTRILANFTGALNTDEGVAGFLENIGLSNQAILPESAVNNVVDSVNGFIPGSAESTGAGSGDNSTDQYDDAPIRQARQQQDTPTPVTQETKDPAVLGAINNLKRSIDNQTTVLSTAIQNSM